MTATKKIIAVVGATGAQGGSVAKYFLKNGQDKFTVRALTRNVDKPAAKELAALGAEVVAADMNDQSSLEAVFKGANIIYVVTNFFETVSVEDELRVGTNSIKAALAVDSPTLEQFFFSSLPDVRTQSKPFLRAVHMNTKNDICNYLKTTALWKKSSIVQVGYYMENYRNVPESVGPVKGPDGTYVVAHPLKPTSTIGIVSVADVGTLIYKLAESPAKYYERTISFVSQYMTAPDMVKIWSEIIGVKARFQQVTLEEYVKNLQEKYGYPEFLAVDMGEMLAAFGEYPDVFAAEGVIDGGALVKGQISDWATSVRNQDWSKFTE